MKTTNESTRPEARVQQPEEPSAGERARSGCACGPLCPCGPTCDCGA